MNKSIWTIAAVLLWVAVSNGCTQYNGAPLFRSKGDEVVYQDFLHQRQEELARAQSQEPAVDPGNTVAEFGSPNLPPPSLPVVPARLASADPEMARLGLFGQMPETLPQGRSAMAGPDNLSQVTFATAGADMDPRVDPTGKWLVYASTRHRPKPDIYLQRIDGTAVQQITNDPGADRMPVFSSDGRSIAFASDRGGNWDIYLTDVNGANPQQLTNDQTHDLHPSFSPDGKQLVYCSYGAQSGQWELVVIDVANPAKKRFIGFGLFPDWSPVSNKILFQRPRQRGTHWFSVWTIEYVDGQGMRPTEVAASSNAGAITPRWSPDGRQFVFCTVVNPSAVDDSGLPQQADVWIADADGSVRVNLTQNAFANIQPTWAPDGAIYFVSNRGLDAMENVWAIRPGEATRLAHPATSGNTSGDEASVMVPTAP